METKKLQWSTDSAETLEFCRKAGYIPDVHFVKTALYDGILFVSQNCGKQFEYDKLQTKVDGMYLGGYAYCASEKVRPYLIINRLHAIISNDIAEEMGFDEDLILLETLKIIEEVKKIRAA
jgi:hypothetical protein